MKKSISTIILFYLCTQFSISQDNILLHYNDSTINNLIKLYKFSHFSEKISIYSIQLKASENPDKITSIKNQYKKLHPNEIIEEIFEPPYFKVFVGYYLDPKKAQKKLTLIQKKFKSAFVLERETSIQDLKKNIQ